MLALLAKMSRRELEHGRPAAKEGVASLVVNCGKVLGVSSAASRDNALRRSTTCASQGPTFRLPLVELVEAALLVGALAERLEEAVPCEAQSNLEWSCKGGRKGQDESADEEPPRGGRIVGEGVEGLLERIEPNHESRGC